MKTDREKALEWFSELGMRKYSLLKENNLDLGLQFTEGFKSKIEEIWKKEIQSKCENKQQVDFGLLQRTIQMISNYNNIEEIEFSKKENDNIQLFFELLTKSSSFAHKAHKELNKLNK